MRTDWGRPALAVVWLLIAPDLSAQIQQGDDLQVNTYTSGNQQSPAIAVAPNDTFLVVWASEGSAGSDYEAWSIQARSFAANGSPLGHEFQVNTFTTGSQYQPRVTVDSNGDFVVVWQSADEQYPETRSIRGRRFSGGSPTGPEFVVHSRTENIDPYGYRTDIRLDNPTPAAGPNGQFVVVWNTDWWTYDIVGEVHCRTVRGRRVAEDGTPLGDLITVDTGCSGGCSNLAWIDDFDVAATDSQFVIVWDYYDYGDENLWGKRHSWTGAELGSFEVVPSAYDVGWKAGSLAARTDRFLVTWTSAESPGTDTSENSVLGRFLSSDGTPLGEAFQLNSYTTGNQGSPMVAADPDGDLLVVWQSAGSAGSDQLDASIQARRLDWADPVMGDEIQVNNHTPGDQLRAFSAGGVVVWDSPDSPGDDSWGRSILATPVSLAFPGGLVGWWRAEGDAADSSAEANHGTLMGGTAFTDGAIERAFSFDGVDDYIAIADDDSLDMGTGDFSITFWLRTVRMWPIVLDKRTFSPRRGYHVYLQDGHPGLQLKDDAGTTKFTSDLFVSDGRYHFVAITVDRDGPGRIWVDDNPPFLFDPTVRSGSLDSEAELRLARQSDPWGAGYFEGALDEPRIYNRTLSEEAVEYLFSQAAGVVFTDGFESGDTSVWSDSVP